MACSDFLWILVNSACWNSEQVAVVCHNTKGEYGKPEGSGGVK